MIVKSTTFLCNLAKVYATFELLYIFLFLFTFLYGYFSHFSSKQIHLITRLSSVVVSSVLLLHNNIAIIIVFAGGK